MPSEEKVRLTDTILRFLQGTGKPVTVNGLLKELPKEQKKPNLEKAMSQLVDVSSSYSKYL
jgi:hypothetical protein